MDTGFAAYLYRWPNAATLENDAMDGAFLETYVVTEIVKSYYNAEKPVDLFYYQDINKKEIDLLIIEGDKLYPIENLGAVLRNHYLKFHISHKTGSDLVFFKNDHYISSIINVKILLL